MAAVLQQALGEAVLASQVAPGTAWEPQAHRWAWLMPSLLLRAPGAGADEHMGATAAVTKVVRRRLQLAETSQWQLLLKDVMADADAAKTDDREASPRQAPAGEHAARLKRAQAAVTKARAGNLRGGLQVLTGEGVEGGTPETVDKLKALVLEERADADKDGQLEAQLVLARAA